MDQQFLFSGTPLVTCDYTLEQQREKLIEEINEFMLEVGKEKIGPAALLSEFFDVQQTLQTFLYAYSVNFGDSEQRLWATQDMFKRASKTHNLKMQQRVKKYDGLKLVSK